jgi:DNA-binding GntR family transcriptional regulator
MTSASQSSPTVYDRILRKVFSGETPPGSKLVERQLAAELGVSRVPVRETLTKLVAQGVLVGGPGQGVRVRRYSTDEVCQLYQFREMIEGGTARAAANAASESDLVRLEMICQQMREEVGSYGSVRWADLDHKFHEAIADASRNERFIQTLRTLLAESHYVFYLHPARHGRPKPSAEEARAFMESVVHDHEALLELIRQRDGDGAERKVRQDMRKSAERATRALIENDLTGDGEDQL